MISRKLFQLGSRIILILVFLGGINLTSSSQNYNLMDSAKVYKDIGEFETALKFYEEVNKLKPGKFWSFYSEAELLFVTGNEEKGLKVAKQGLGLAEAAGNSHYVEKFNEIISTKGKNIEILTKEKRDDNKYNFAIESNTISAYEDYIKDFPEGSHIEEAKKRISNLREEQRIAEAKKQREAEIEAEKRRLEEEKRLTIEKQRKEKELKLKQEREAKIAANSNSNSWSLGDRICSKDYSKGTIQVVIEQWNETKSKAKVKILGGPEGDYKGEVLEKGGLIWVDVKDWYKCLGDEDIDYNLSKNEQINKNKNSDEEKVDKVQAGKYANVFARKFVINECKGPGNKRDIKFTFDKVEVAGDGDGFIYENFNLTYYDGGFSVGTSVVKLSFTGILLINEYGNEVYFLIAEKETPSWLIANCTLKPFDDEDTKKYIKEKYGLDVKWVGIVDNVNE